MKHSRSQPHMVTFLKPGAATKFETMICFLQNNIEEQRLQNRYIKSWTYKILI